MANYVVEHNLSFLPLRRRDNLCGLALRKKYRSHFEIVASILDAAKDDGEDKYYLMKQTGVNYAQLKRYLKSVAEIGLVETGAREGRVVYKASEKGLLFLRHYHVLDQMFLNSPTFMK